jgi:hypothetical protein
MADVKLTVTDQKLITKAIDFYFDNYFYYNRESFKKYERVLRKMPDIKNPRLKKL